jgi:hypothetical protein
MPLIKCIELKSEPILSLSKIHINVISLQYHSLFTQTHCKKFPKQNSVYWFSRTFCVYVCKGWAIKSCPRTVTFNDLL